MSYLNEKNDKTEKIIHLLVTPLCNRHCKHCCNKQYDLNDIPVVTEEELKNAHTICITGGEPFLFSDPYAIAYYYKHRYKNIKNVYVYTNALELSLYLKIHKKEKLFKYIDGVNVSIKHQSDVVSFKEVILNDERINKMNSNLLYVFDDLYKDNVGNFKFIKRTWQPDFKPADDSIFRRI